MDTTRPIEPNTALPQQAENPDRRAFVTTRWSIVRAVGGIDSERARQALSQLCHTYWYPLYAYVRRRGYSPEDAQDLTQAFFARLLEKHSLAGIRSEGGKFRSFLLSALNNFLIDEWKRAKALKRGALQIVSWDALRAETRFRNEPAGPTTPEGGFDRLWAVALLDEVFQQVQREYQAADKGELFEHLKFCLTGERHSLPYVELAGTLNVSESALKVMVHRLRQRYRELLRAEVANTVDRPEEVEEELRYLFRALAG